MSRAVIDPTQKHRRRRLALSILLLATAGITIVAWLVWDLPRRRVEATLAERLGAEVRLGRLSIRGARTFLLYDLEIRRMASQPLVEHLAVGTLYVLGSLAEIRQGRFEELRLADAELHVARPPPAPRETRPAGRLVAGRLGVIRGRVVVAGKSTAAVLEAEGELTGVGTDLSGEILFRSESFPAGPLIELLRPAAKDGAPRDLLTGLDLSVQGLAASLRVSAGGANIDMEGTARGAVLSRDARALSVTEPRVGLAARRSADGRLHIEARPELNIFSSGLIVADLDTRTGESLSIEARLLGLDVGPVLPVLSALPQGWVVSGRADIEVESRAGGPLRSVIDARLTHLGPPDADPRVQEAFFPSRVRFTGELGTPGSAALNGRAFAETASVGSFEATGSVALGPGDPSASLRWRFKGPGRERLAFFPTLVGIEVPDDMRLDGSLEGEGSVAGPLIAPAVEGSLRLGALSATRSSRDGEAVILWSFRDGMGSARYRWQGPRGPIEVASFDLRGKVEIPPLRAVPFELRASGAADPFARGFRIEQAAVDMSDLGSVRLTGAWKAGVDGNVEVHARDADLTRWQSFLGPVTEGIGAAYSFRGKAEADLSASGGRGGWTASGKVSVRRPGVESKDGARVIEGNDTDWDVEIRGGARDGDLTLRAKTTEGGFRILWDTLYADYSRLRPPVELSARAAPLARGSPERQGWEWDGLADLTLPGGSRLHVSARDSPSGPLLYGFRLELQDLGGLFEREVIGPLGDTFPRLGRLRAGGSLDVSLEGRLDETVRTVQGRARLRGFDLEGARETVLVKGLDLDLPIDLEWEGTFPEPWKLRGDELEGSLRFSRLRFGETEFPATSTRLRIHADSVAFEEDLRLPFLGGTLQFEKLTLVELLDPARRLDAGIELQGLKLEELTRAAGWPLLEGELEGSFPRMRLSQSILEVEGGGQVFLFGGVLTFGDISGESVLSRYPKIGFSADFKDIDLARLTRRFDFGEMTGMLHGYLRQCELFRGVPVRFEAQIEADQGKGDPPVINIKAINNIAILGTGGGIGVLERGIRRFLDHYTYEKLGIRMRLEDDVFLIRGLERRGDRELFLKGRLPFRIDVVNVRPGQAVSFRAMVDRLRRLDLARVTTAAF